MIEPASPVIPNNQDGCIVPISQSVVWVGAPTLPDAVYNVLVLAAYIGDRRPRLQPVFGISPALGWVRVPAPAAAASIYSSAILAASLKIATNIGRVSFPV